MAYTRVTSNDLERHTRRPTHVKMLVHNSIEDSLYNPHYGYLSRQATVFTSAGDPIDFRAMHDLVEFEFARRYTAYGMDEERPGRQIWHTPQNCPMYVLRLTSHLSVLLILAHRLSMDRPSFNQCLASEYRLKYFPYVSTRLERRMAR